MSFLAPLYFLGALAVAGPIIFHLIRRQPRGEVEFSSLMFLDSTPPRLTRRSRLENWPLLLLRCAAILLLAFAFARPFLPISESDSVAGVKQAVVVLIDQSASMKRAGLWDQAKNKAMAILDESDDETLLSVIAFDSEPHSVLSLDESTRLVADTRKTAAREAIDALAPTWFSTDVGKAIRYAADQAALLELGDSENAAATPNNPIASAAIETRIVLLSDLQSGAGIETLQGYEWPSRVWLDVQPLTASTRGNVSLRVMPQRTAADTDDSLREAAGNAVRVQVSQADDGETSTFRLRFNGQDNDAAVVQVPPGQTRFFTVKLPDAAPTDASSDKDKRSRTATLDVFGDRDSFDNTYHFIRPSRVSQQVRFAEMSKTNAPIEASAAARETLSFYARQLPWSDATRHVDFNLTQRDDWTDGLSATETPLVIASGSSAAAANGDAVEQYLSSGGRILVVLDGPVDDATGAAIAALLKAPKLTIGEADAEDYRLISSVDFTSSLIAPLSDPGVNDFSNIRIWKHRQLQGLGDSLAVTLKLDDGSPLLVRRDVVNDSPEVPDGKLWVLATGWQPAQSQFALSTKFVPILLGTLGPNLQLAPESLTIGDALADSSIASEPGFVEIDGETFAVNLEPSESETESFDMDRISGFGAVISSPLARQQEQIAQRALRDVELEAKQGWWQWLILATLGFIAAETLLAAKERPAPQAEA
ncbi:BatA domain-containing protein [Rhodopirellula sp. JC639]|uniref:BatA domain-containing protein n=1 Tax=Stieleria mannarensis TaxID=2755585 RepID=UPI001602F04B|nr:BatA domain-containing protein [Rhodopirellula sp. JC639]